MNEPFFPAHLGDGVVRRVRRLQALVARDSNTNVSCLDHPDVIGSITDGQRDDLYLLLHHLHYLGLLQRGNSTGGQAPKGKLLIYLASIMLGFVQ